MQSTSNVYSARSITLERKIKQIFAPEASDLLSLDTLNTCNKISFICHLVSCPRLGVAAGRSNPTPEARDGGGEKHTHIQGVAAAQEQEGLEEPSYIDGRKGGGEETPLIQGKEQP